MNIEIQDYYFCYTSKRETWIQINSIPYIIWHEDFHRKILFCITDNNYTLLQQLYAMWGQELGVIGQFFIC